MIFFVDADQLVFANSDFANYEDSPAVFYPLSGELAQRVLQVGSILALTVEETRKILVVLEPKGRKLHLKP
jgi:hypothetical protein